MNQALTGTADQLADAGALAKEATADVEIAASGTAREGERPQSRQRYAGREWVSDHPLNIRITIPFGFGQFYVALVAGKERRARARLALDRRQNPLYTPGNLLFLAFVTVIATAGSVSLFYILLAHAFGWSGRLLL